MPQLIVVYWRDIPAQVIGKMGRKTVKRILSHRFQEAVDRAAMRAGKGSSDAYLSEWRRIRKECSGDLEQEVAIAADRFEQTFSDDDLSRLIRAKGVDQAHIPDSSEDV